MAPYTELETQASSESVVKSPRLAAMGVATLSGLILKYLDIIITNTITRPI